MRQGRGRVGRGEAQGGCACCAVRGSLWVRDGGDEAGERQGGCG